MRKGQYQSPKAEESKSENEAKKKQVSGENQIVYLNTITHRDRRQEMRAEEMFLRVVHRLTEKKMDTIAKRTDRAVFSQSEWCIMLHYSYRTIPYHIVLF